MDEIEVMSNEDVSSESTSIDDVQDNEVSESDNEALVEVREILNDIRSEQSKEVNTVVEVSDEQYEHYLKIEAANNVCLVVLIALLVVLIGVQFGSILTRHWNNK